MNTATAARAQFSIERSYAASLEEAWALWTTKAGIESWWGPEGFRNTFEVFEFRPGGLWRFVMHGPDGQDYANESRFDALEPAARVSIRHVCAPHFTLEVRLQAEDGGTRVHWAQTFDDAATARAVASTIVSTSPALTTSGGAPGAEAAFGACAEQYGIDEVNFTFEGHTEAALHRIESDFMAALRRVKPDARIEAAAH